MTRFSFLITVAFFLFAVNAKAVNMVSDIPSPEGFERAKVSSNSFASYLRSLPLKHNKQIKLWDGRILSDDAYATLAVIGLPLLFNEDLEQCADFGMRFWAEYLRSTNELDKLSLFDFYGRKKTFSKSQKPFRDYLQWHMRYSNSYSLKLGASKVALLNELRAGDMFVQNDSEEGIGHVSVVIDEAIDSNGLKVYLVGYSFMPAQQFHIEKAANEYGQNGWFTAEGFKRYAEQAFGLFGKPIVMRFQKDPT